MHQKCFRYVIFYVDGSCNGSHKRKNIDELHLKLHKVTDFSMYRIMYHIMHGGLALNIIKSTYLLYMQS